MAFKSLSRRHFLDDHLQVSFRVLLTAPATVHVKLPLGRLFGGIFPMNDAMHMHQSLSGAVKRAFGSLMPAEHYQEHLAE